MALALLLFLVRPLPARGAVVLSEIHYHPPSSESRDLEFVEVHNPGPAAAAMGGWRLQGGVEFEFPPATVLSPGARLAVCRDPGGARARYGGPAPAFLGGLQGSLENAGETVLLVDAFDALVDAVDYDDRLPWPEEADGRGGSIQRRCASAPSGDPLNWIGEAPTPGAPTVSALCPPPAYRTPRVVLSELHYHPSTEGSIHPAVEDGEDEEFVELHNPGPEAVDLGGWSLADGVSFTFPPGVIIPRGGFLAVCRNASAVRERFGIAEAVGDYSGKLANAGERVALFDDEGRWVDSVRFADSGDWPYGADGFGASLEKVVLTASSDDPANWAPSALPSGGFRRLSGEGKLGQGLSQRFLLSLDGPGEVLVDEVVLEDLARPGQNLLPNGSFDGGIAGWSASGFAAGSTFDPQGGEGGTGALRLISTGVCDGECGAANAVSASIPPGLDRDASYRVSVVFRRVRGSSIFRAGRFGAVEAAVDRLATPGRANSSSAEEVPPSISSVRRFPREPRSTDPVWITAHVRGGGAVSASLTYDAGTGPVEVAMLDDGLHRDGAPGDGVFGAELPPQKHDTPVRFRIRALVGGRTAGHPQLRFPDSPLPEEVDGYYVNDLRPDTGLPIYNVLLAGVSAEDPEALNRVLGCAVLKKASFALRGDLYPDIGLRFRGYTACYIKKRNLKVVFNRGRLLGRLRKLNLNGLWTDKSLVREHLAWEFLREIGAPYSKTSFVRVHLNGSYHGLFLDVEHPDERFLERNGLDDCGNLYKAVNPSTEDAVGVEVQSTVEGYRALWSEESNEGGDFTDLAQFVGDMHRDGRSPGGPSSDFWAGNSLEEMVIDYQLGQVVLNNIDSYAKNHFLYHDLAQGRWGFLAWDLDLTFGKFFTFDALGPGREVGTLNDVMLSDPGGEVDLDPWFASGVNQPVQNRLIDFFLRAGGNHYHRGYLLRLWDILEEKYRNETYDPRLDALRASLAEEEAEDFARWGRYPSNVPGFPEDMDGNIAIVKGQIALHRRYLRDFIRREAPQIPLQPRVKIVEVMYWPEGNRDDLEFIEFANTAGKAVDLSGWTVEGVEFVFPAGSVVPAGETFVLARSPEALRARHPGRTFPFLFGPFPGRLANEGEELKLADAGPGYPAVIERLRYESRSPWPEVEPGRSIELTAVSADRDSEAPENWTLSAEVGGSPGTLVPPRFLRADSNGDREVDISDVAFTLAYLYLAGEAPSCMDAVDADDNGELEITDPLFVLAFLFLSGSPPQPGPDACGSDPTPDDPLPACGYDPRLCEGAVTR